MLDGKLTDKLKEKLLNAVGKYADYTRFSRELDYLEEEYDETLEIYNYKVWFEQSRGTIQGKAAEMLRITAKLFWDMEENARKELCNVLKEIMEYKQEEQEQIWGQKIFLNRNIITDEMLEDMIFEWKECPYVQAEALESFEKFLFQELIKQGEK